METLVKVKYDDATYGDCHTGEEGYIDGYVRGGNNTPFACVVIGEDIKLIPLRALQVIEN